MEYGRVMRFKHGLSHVVTIKHSSGGKCNSRALTHFQYEKITTKHRKFCTRQLLRAEKPSFIIKFHENISVSKSDV